MKILQVITTLSSAAGGPVEGLIQQGIALTAMGHDVQTLCLDAPGSLADRRLKSSQVYTLGPKLLTYSFTSKLQPWLHEHARSFDVLIVHGIWTYHAFSVAKICRKLSVPYVVFVHGMLDPWFASAFPLKHLKKWLYWPWAEYRTLRDAALVLFTAQEELLLARKSFWLYKVRERMVGYGIADRTIGAEEARTAFLNKFPALRETRNLLYLSRLHPKKGCDLLIKAFAKVANQDADLHLVMGGPGDPAYVRGLQSLAAELDVSSRVTFTGMLREEMKWGAYDCAEVFALPSHQENFGIVLAEALCSHLPVLTTRQVNIWREIWSAGAGLIDVDTQEGADRLLAGWLRLSYAERAEMRQKARGCFVECFHVDRVTQNLVGALGDATLPTKVPHTFTGSARVRSGEAA